jgi:hypothetical protein
MLFASGQQCLHFSETYASPKLFLPDRNTGSIQKKNIKHKGSLTESRHMDLGYKSTRRSALWTVGGTTRNYTDDILCLTERRCVPQVWINYGSKEQVYLAPSVSN